MHSHKDVGFQDEGEKFFYILKGSVQIIIGDHVNILQKGGSFNFNSGIKHDLKNVGKKDAALIVVVYSP